MNLAMAGFLQWLRNVLRYLGNPRDGIIANLFLCRFV
jgi:hypothetical protein